MGKQIKGKVAWFVPDPIAGSGGHRTIISHASHLAERGYQNTLFVDTGLSVKDATRRLVEYFGPVPGAVRLGLSLDDDFDALIATGWWTAIEAAKYPEIRHKIYFVQDMEAYFNPIGSHFLRAMETYRFDLFPITIGRWLSHRIQADFGKPVQYFSFGVDHACYRRLAHGNADPENAICFVYQDDKPRRCADFVIEAISAIQKACPNTAVYTFGQGKGPRMGGVKHLGLLTRPQLNELYNRCRVGVCMSSTNPSRIPFEMMSSGLPVVDLYSESNLFDHSHEAILLARPDPYSVAEAAISILSLSDASWRERSAQAQRFVANRSEDSERAEFFQAFERVIRDEPIGSLSVEKSYGAAPIDAGNYVPNVVSPERRREIGLPYRPKIEPLINDLAKASRAVLDLDAASAADLHSGLDREIQSESVKLLSVDIWDTLLLRQTHPDEIKLMTAKFMLERLFENIHEFYTHPERLMALRVLCERELGEKAREAGRDDEYSVRDVIANVLRLCLKRPHSDQPEVDAIVAFEIRNEVRNARINRNLEDLLIESKKPTVLVSDFYMVGSELREVLSGAEMRLAPVDVYSSCERGYNKRSGALFKLLSEERQCPLGQILHIGDNKVADVDPAVALGMKAVHYRYAEHEKQRERSRRAWKGRFDGRAEQAIERIRCSEKSARNNAETMRQLGLASAPAFSGFCQFISYIARCKGLKRVHFFTREGIFFARAFDAWQQGIDASSRLNTSVLPVSRMATFLPSLFDSSPDELMRLWNQYSSQSVRDLMASLQMGDVDAKSLDSEIDFNKVWKYPWKHNEIIQFLESPKFSDLFRRRRKSARDLLQKMLTENGFALDGENLIVDIGWRGTIQDNLAFAFPGATIHGVYLGLNKFLNTQPPRGEKHAFVADLNAGNKRYASFVHIARPIEMLCNGLGGSVIGYQEGDDGRVSAKTLIDPNEDVIHADFARHFQDGVVQGILDAGRGDVASSASVREAAQTAGAILDFLVKNPPYALAVADGRLHHNETFGLGRVVVPREIETKQWVMALLSAKSRGEIMRLAKSSGWAHGFLRRQLGGAPLRWARYRGRI